MVRQGGRVVRHSKSGHSMSAMGQKQTSEMARITFGVVVPAAWRWSPESGAPRRV